MTLQWPVRRQGDEDQVVRSLQHLLNSHEAGLTADGVFGELTHAAVAAFQQGQGFTPDGIAGPAVWNALIVDLRFGATGDAVRAAQTQLYIRGTLPEVDGTYSMKMNISVHRFQALKGLNANGTVDAQTWHALISDTNLPETSRDLSSDGFDWQQKLRSMLRPDG